MITLSDQPVILQNNVLLSTEEAKQRGIDLTSAKDQTLAARILASHHQGAKTDSTLRLRFDALASHDITYVGIIQTARASGLDHFPVPYVLTNCHNSLCAVGGTINEDDHRFGLSAARKYGGIFVPPHLAVIHQYVREMLAGCGSMILGSDSHTRYGALGTLGVGEGGPELVKQLLGKTYDVPRPEVLLIWLEGSPQPGVGPQDIALALIAAVFKSGFAKNKILEFQGPGVDALSIEYRCGIDVMTTETTCLSSIWKTDEKVQAYLALHGRASDYAKLEVAEPAYYDGSVHINLSAIEPMIALPFHPSNAWPIREVLAHADDLLGSVDEAAEKQFGAVGKNLQMRAKYRNGGVWAEQGIIAGCAGGSFENITLAAAILRGQSTGNGAFSLSLYPASEPQALALARNGSYADLMSAGAILKNAFCGPCFGAGDTPANGTLSLRHSTRNFPNREGSKPGNGQLSAVALMDARSIAATARNGGRLTPATELDWTKLQADLNYHFETGVYQRRVYNGFQQAKAEEQLIFGPNIADWPAMSPLPTHLLLRIASHITDPVTTTDELIPSGETSSLRSNPLKLAEYALSRRDPGYVARAKEFQRLEKARLDDPQNPALQKCLQAVSEALKSQNQEAVLGGKTTVADFGLGTAVFAIKPGDGSAREQAASCQKVLGGWANIAVDYATKRYRSNLINWGMLPLLSDPALAEQIAVGDYVLLPQIRKAMEDAQTTLQAFVLQADSSGKIVRTQEIVLHLAPLTADERQIILAGCLINYYNTSSH